MSFLNTDLDSKGAIEPFVWYPTREVDPEKIEEGDGVDWFFLSAYQTGSGKFAVRWKSGGGVSKTTVGQGEDEREIIHPSAWTKRKIRYYEKKENAVHRANILCLRHAYRGVSSEALEFPKRAS